ncbi:MAG: geranylgeranyl pyrophosphate synthase [Candidatus Hydrogenedentota bacterium]
MPQISRLEYLAERKLAVEHALNDRLPSADVEPRPVHAAMRYAALGGGKRLRPIVAMAVAEAGGVDGERVLDAACAIEFVHTASLILDDLPSMDNAKSRRDRPCTHAIHGEATAILASLGLIASAFELVTRNAETMLDKEGVAEVVCDLAGAIGTRGLIQGQHVDLTLHGAATLDDLEHIYRQKAAALFLAAVTIPARLVSMREPEGRALRKFAVDLGVAFQITDDLIDAHPDTDHGQKATFATFLGERGARDKAIQLIDEAISALDILGERGVPLRTIAEYVSKRTF